MSDTVKNEQQPSMEELLNSYGPENKEALRVGSKLRGRIISVGKESVFMDTGSKVDGVVDIAELVDENGDLPYQVGDTLELYVVSIRHGEIRLSKAGNLQGRLPCGGRQTQRLLPGKPDRHDLCGTP
jgi:small subunit ribosomal protein S1